MFITFLMAFLIAFQSFPLMGLAGSADEVVGLDETYIQQEQSRTETLERTPVELSAAEKTLVMPDEESTEDSNAEAIAGEETPTDIAEAPVDEKMKSVAVEHDESEALPTGPTASSVDPLGKAGVTIYANKEYRALVGDDVADAEIERIVSSGSVKLVAEDGTTYIGSRGTGYDANTLFFDGPLGVYSIAFTSDAISEGFSFAPNDAITDNKITIRKEYRTSWDTTFKGFFFAKDVEVKTGKIAVSAKANAEYRAAVGDEVADSEEQRLIAEGLLVLTDGDGTVHTGIRGTGADADAIIFDVPVGTYSIELTDTGLA